MSARTWKYEAQVLEVHDGDTVYVDVDLGMETWRRGVHVRVAHIDAPELATTAGKEARDYAQTLLKPGDVVALETHEYDKYGRLLASITFDRSELGLRDADFATVMQTSGHADAYEGGKRG
jgi:endonuclease YncB( thermonuclease family)